MTSAANANHPLRTAQDFFQTPDNVLAELRRKQEQEDTPQDRPERLPIASIHKREELFQPRQIDEKHISDLVRHLKSAKELEPVVVVQVGRDAYLIDGHHRIEAYRRTKVASTIPVRYFEGTLEEAVLEAGRANAKAKLPMDTRQRMDYAWRLVCLESYSKSQIVEAACVSDGQVAQMRRAKRELGEDARLYTTWLDARRDWQKQQPELSDADHEARLEAIAQQHADRLAKTFSSKLANNPAIAARVFAIYFGRRLPELVEELQDYLPEAEDAEEEL